MSQRPPRVELLKTPFLRSFAAGRAAATMGAQIVSVTAGWQLYDITHDPWSLAVVGLVELAPAVALVLPAGNAADRHARRNVAMLASALAALAAAGLAVVSALHLPIAFIYVCLCLIGVARVFASPSVSGIIPQLLKPELLPGATAWLASGYELASITGPGIGGFLVAVSPTLAYGVAGIGQLVFIAVLATFPVVTPERAVQRKPGDLLAGLRFIQDTPLLLAAITLDLFVVLFGGAVSLLPVFARDILMVGPEGLGWLRAAPSLGALTMALVLTRMPPWKKPGRVLYVAVVGFAAANIGFALSRSMGLSLAFLFLSGLCDEVSVVLRLTLQHLITPDRLRGRVWAVRDLFAGFSNELGAFESGAAASLFGPVVGTVGGGVISLVVIATVAVLWPALVRIAPLHELQPLQALEPSNATGPRPINGLQS